MTRLLSSPSSQGLVFFSLPSRSSRALLPRHAACVTPRTAGRRVARCDLAAQGHGDVKVAVASSAVGPVVVTDESVPEGHQGLHGFLYGEGGADVHDAQEGEYVVRAGEDEGEVLIALPQFLALRQGHKIAGVYAVFDAQGSLQYVGYSRNMVLAIKAHSVHPGTAAQTASVRVRVFRDPALVTRTRLDQERALFLQQLSGGEIPPGHTHEALPMWEGRGGPAAGSAAVAMSEEERAAYEDKKLKMRKAMGENLHDEVEGEALDARQRRLNLLQAVEGDNWSGIIQAQTARTQPAAPPVSPPPPSTPGPSLPGTSGTLTSPFAEGQSGAGRGGEGEEEEEEEEEGSIPMTPDNVDRVLEAVRPYLIADGGNVSVVGVKDGVVELLLQGACGSCPSATTTMKMGIERVLREKFGEQLVEVKEVGGALDAVVATVKSVDAHLDMLRPAIQNFNGSVEVLSVDADAGTCEIRYSGPPPIFMGIQAAIKDKFPTITTVTQV